MRIIGHSFLGMVLALPALFGCDAMTTDPGEVEDSESALSAAAASESRNAVLRDVNGDVVARVGLRSAGRGFIQVSASFDFPGIAPGFHGFHIHANDNPANGDGCIADPAQPANTHFVSADGHWNPDAVTHGDHAGDLPSPLVQDNGSAAVSFIHRVNSLSDVVGRAIILHEGADNFGNIPVGPAVTQYTPNGPEATTLTQNTGNAGNRIACGLIR